MREPGLNAVARAAGRRPDPIPALGKTLAWSGALDLATGDRIILRGNELTA